MKRILWILVLAFAGWLGYTKWVNQDFPYPWEYLRTAPDIEETLAWKSYSTCWDNFRLNFPYHIQTIGVSDFEQDGSRILIVSEPPKHFSAYEAENIFSHFNIKSEIKTHTIGYDGWVKDFVVVLSGGSDRQKKRAIEKLYEYVFQSNYKPHFLNLSKNFTDKLNSGSNYSISAAEINNWFVEGEDKWFVDANDSEKEEILDKLLNTNEYGVYYSKKPGFVAWVMPKGSITDYVKDARRFTLDADIIIGAIAGSSSLAIIGRERTSNEFALPPLRVETILQLAAADKQQISQSYERMNMFAGKISGGQDWAPIYLSDDLLNTEYGSLLNITDQMLKGWSQHGEITYHNFMYSKPTKYPFEHSVTEEINTPSLTFNWNTKGAAYVVKYNEFDVVALNRTGSLPVTYIPEGIDHSEIPFEKVRECEEKFYDFFSSLKDPNLVRVVQYAAIYQIFSAFDVTAYGQKNVANKPTQDVTAEYSNKLLSAILNYKGSAEPSFADILSNYREGEDADNSAFMSAFVKILSSGGFESAINAVKPKISTISDRFGSQGMEVLSFIMGHPRFDRDFSYNTAQISENSVTEIVEWYQANNEHFQNINQNIDQLGISRKEVMDKYVNSYNGSHEDWIKTPSIVISWSTDSTFSTGGHNIDARMLGLQVDRSLVSGQVKVIEQNGVRRLLVAADDVNRITPTMIRELETRGAVGIQRVEGKMLGGTVRNRNSVLSSTSKSERGFAEPSKNYAKFVKEDIEVASNGVPYKRYNINGQEYVGETHAPFVVFPKSKIAEIDGITSAMKGRKISNGEFKVLSFVDDASTTSTLKNYCHKNFLETPITSISDLKVVFSKNPKKTFHLVGHIEDGAIYVPETGVKLPLNEIQLIAEQTNVNYMIVGCESAFQKGSGAAGFAYKINSVEVSKALGMALESSKDVYTFTHTLARNSRLQLIVYEVPMKDLGYTASKLTKTEKVVAVVGGAVLGAGAATGLIITVSGGGGEDDDDDDEKNKDS